MQSTGQGGTHSSQPAQRLDHGVHLLGGADDGIHRQAWMHSVQPMQTCSSMTATDFGFSTPCSSERFELAAEQVGELADALLAAGGHWLMSASPLAIASA